MVQQAAFIRNFNFKRVAGLLLAGATVLSSLMARADEPATPVPSEHQLMKDCMAKQKAAENPLPHADLRKACRDVTKNEKQNDQRAASDAQDTAQK